LSDSVNGAASGVSCTSRYHVTFSKPGKRPVAMPTACTAKAPAKTSCKKKQRLPPICDERASASPTRYPRRRRTSATRRRDWATRIKPAATSTRRCLCAERRGALSHSRKHTTRTACRASRRLQYPSHRLARPAVNGRRAQSLERGHMRARGVTLVLGEAVTRVMRVQPNEFAIARDLGKDRRSGDGGHGLVAFDDGLCATRQFSWAAIAVDQREQRHGVQREHRAFHCKHAGPQNVERVDLLNLGVRHGPGQRLLLDLDLQRLAPLLGEQLGIGETLDGPRGIEDHRSRRHRTRERATPGLVHPCYQNYLAHHRLPPQAA